MHAGSRKQVRAGTAKKAQHCNRIDESMTTTFAQRSALRS